MAGNFQAFAVQSVLENFQKRIEALEAVTDGLLLGLVDGTLVLLKPNPLDASDKWQVAQAYRNVCKRSATQLQVSCSAR